MKELIQHIKNSILNEQWKSYVIFSGGTYVIVENFKRDFSLKNYTLEYMKNNVSEFMDSAGFDIVRLWECDDFVAHLSDTNIFVYIEGYEYGGMFGGDMDVMLQARTILADDLQQQEIIHIEDKMQGDVIDFYRVHDTFGEFSNFARFPIQLKGKTWPTSEHYFQAQKFAGTAHEETVRNAKNAWWAAKYGRELASLPEDWDEKRLEVMIDAVSAKFKQHPQLKKLLLDTGNAILIEKTKQDNFWADGGDGSGQNYLGKILMMVREELKQGKSKEKTINP